MISYPEKRKLYDQFGGEWSAWQRAGGNNANDFWNQWAGSDRGGRQHPRGGYSQVNMEDFLGGEGFSDFFQQLFGGGMPGGGGDPFGGGRRTTRRPTQARKGQDHEQPVEITLEEAYQGTSRGFTLGNQRGTLDIPAGVADGTRVCYRGKGAPSMRGGLPGDLYLKVAIQPHPHFTCKGKNLETHIAVDLYTAILGGEVTVPLLTGGEGRLRIAPETPNGKKLRWRGKGMPIRGQEATYGDLDVVVDVVLPVALSDEERALFQQLKTLREKK